MLSEATPISYGIEYAMVCTAPRSGGFVPVECCQHRGYAGHRQKLIIHNVFQGGSSISRTAIKHHTLWCPLYIPVVSTGTRTPSLTRTQTILIWRATPMITAARSKVQMVTCVGIPV